MGNGGTPPPAYTDGTLMTRRQLWFVAYVVLLLGIVATAALNMLQVSGGFFTNHLADLVVPAWLYVVARGLHVASGRTTRLQRWLGRTPERAALAIFIASTVTELSQYHWPRGIFSGRFDPLDMLSYAVSLAVCYAADRLSSRPPDGGDP
jgi:hypothetical protein